MKRRILLSVMMLALIVLALPVAAAQDSQSVWDLTKNFTFTDLGFDIKYPDGWVYTATDSKGVFFAEDKSDLKAVSDDDVSTLGTNSSFQFIAVDVTSLKDQLGDNPSLDDSVDFLMKNSNITEKEKRIEVPVITRRTVTVLGEDEAKQGWILTIWRQADFLVGAFLVSPSYEETARIAFSWGQLLSSIAPTDPLPLSKNTVDLPGTGAEISYPEGWYPDPEHTNIIYELKSDLKNNTNEGFLLVDAEQTLKSLNLKEDATLDEVVDANIASLSLTEPIRREEFILLGQPAVTIRGTDGSGQYLLMAQTIIDGTVLQIGVIGPDEAKIDAFEPTFLAMLQSLHSTKAS